MDEIDLQKRDAIGTQSERADQFAASYVDLPEDPFQDCFRYSRHRMGPWLDRFLPAQGEGARVLDVGCGTGHHIADLRTRGYDVAGVDASPEMLAIARADNPGVDIREADVEDLPFEDGTFDHVVCIEVLRHLPRSDRCISEMARVLKPGGQCLATAVPVLNLNGYALVNRIAHRRAIGDLARHKQAFHSSARLRRELVAAGFGPPEVHGVYVGPVNWVERLAPRALPRVLRRWERWDDKLADRRGVRDLSNMFFVRATKAGGSGG